MPGQLRETSDSITFGRTKVEYGIGVVAIILFGFLALICIWMAIDPDRFGPRAQANRTIAIAGILVFGGFAAMGSTLTKTVEIEFYPRAGTYKYRSGSRITSGSFSDFLGLSLRVRNGKGGPVSFIYLRWRNGNHDFPIASFQDKDIANRELERISSMLGIHVA